MDSAVLINQRVRVLAFYNDGDRSCVPLKMRYKNKEYTFSEIGLVHPTRQGKRMIHVFDVSDGTADFRLEFDAERLQWRLIYMADMYDVID